MQRSQLSTLSLTVIGLVFLFALTARADIIFAPDNIPSLTNVNLPNTACPPGATSITGQANDANVTFDNANAGVLLQSSHGTADIETCPLNSPGWTQLTISPDAGFGFTMLDFKLDVLGTSDGLVTLVATDQIGQTFTDTFALTAGGLNDYSACTGSYNVSGKCINLNGELITSLSFDSTVNLEDIGQVSTEVAELPEPAALAMMGSGLIALAGISALRRRRRKVCC